MSYQRLRPRLRGFDGLRGRLADGYGRRNVFLVGMTVFALASLLGGMAWSGGSVIGFRVLQGVGRGAALILAVSTAVFSAVSARDLQGFLARDGIVLEPDQRQVVQEIIAGARNVDALPLRTAAEVKDPAGIVDRAYQSGLRWSFGSAPGFFRFRLSSFGAW